MKKGIKIFGVGLAFFLLKPAPAGAVDCSLCNPATDICTAIGCIDVTSASGLVGSLQTFALGIGGGIAFLLILVGALQVLGSSGNPEKLNAGKELIGSAIAGLLFIIFSVFILRIITAEILHLPGFTSAP